MVSRITNSAFRVAGIYAAISFAWITFSDRIAASIATDYAHLASFQTAKGFFFVSATTAILFFFSRRQFQRIVAVSIDRERDARSSLREKEALLREINHRVKNNLQVILSLLHLHECDERGYTDLESKIRSIALAHDMLTSAPDMSSIEAGRFASNLAKTLDDRFYADSAELSGSGDETSISADIAVSIGILIAEACSNAAKHGRGDSGKKVSVDIRIQGDGDSIVATIRDDGPGFSDATISGDPGPGRGLGITLMEALAEQIQGRLTLRNDPGAVVELRIPAVR